MHGAEHEMGDQIGIGTGTVSRDEGADVTVPEPVDGMLVPILDGGSPGGQVGEAGAGKFGHEALVAAYHLDDRVQEGQGAGTVIATAGSPAKLDFLGGLGADVTVNHRQADWADQVRKAAPGGIDVALEAVGGEMLRDSIGLLAPFGRVVVFGASAGELASVPVRSLFALKTMAGFSLLAWRAAAPERARADIAELTGLLQTGKLQAATATVLPLAQAAEAHRLLEDRAVLGRLLLVPS